MNSTDYIIRMATTDGTIRKKGKNYDIQIKDETWSSVISIESVK